MSLKIYMNGELVPKEEAKSASTITAFSMATASSKESEPITAKSFDLPSTSIGSTNRPAPSCLKSPSPPRRWPPTSKKTVKANGFTDCYIRVVITRGAGALGLDIRKTSNPQVIIIADMIQLYPPELYEKGLDIVSVSTIRNHPNALNPRIKSLNYLNNILAKIEGQLAGCVEALMVNHKGEVAECTGDNIFVVRKKEIITPPWMPASSKG